MPCIPRSLTWSWSRNSSSGRAPSSLSFGGSWCRTDRGGGGLSGWPQRCFSIARDPIPRYCCGLPLEGLLWHRSVCQRGLSINGRQAVDGEIVRSVSRGSRTVVKSVVCTQVKTDKDNSSSGQVSISKWVRPALHPSCCFFTAVLSCVLAGPLLLLLLLRPGVGRLGATRTATTDVGKERTGLLARTCRFRWRDCIRCLPSVEHTRRGGLSAFQRETDSGGRYFALSLECNMAWVLDRGRSSL